MRASNLVSICYSVSSSERLPPLSFLLLSVLLRCASWRFFRFGGSDSFPLERLLPRSQFFLRLLGLSQLLSSASLFLDLCRGDWPLIPLLLPLFSRVLLFQPLDRLLLYFLLFLLRLLLRLLSRLLDLDRSRDLSPRDRD